jgi:hypothetical protein
LLAQCPDPSKLLWNSDLGKSLSSEQFCTATSRKPVHIFQAQSRLLCSVWTLAVSPNGRGLPATPRRYAVDQFDYAHQLNIDRFQNLLETSISNEERRTLQTLLIEQKTKQALRGAQSTTAISPK